MTEGAFTPGPWHAKPRGTQSETWEVAKPTFREFEIVAEGGHIIADLRWNGLNQGPAGAANAILLAASPMLLQGLEAVVKALQHHDPAEQQRRLHSMWRELVDICARARGEQPVYEDKRAAKSLAKS